MSLEHGGCLLRQIIAASQLEDPEAPKVVVEREGDLAAMEDLTPDTLCPEGDCVVLASTLSRMVFESNGLPGGRDDVVAAAGAACVIHDTVDPFRRPSAEAGNVRGGIGIVDEPEYEFPPADSSFWTE